MAKTKITTAVVAIGNSDNKLTQERWAEFTEETRNKTVILCEEVFFYGHSNPFSKFQNANLIFTIAVDRLDTLRNSLRFLAKKYDQESIALIVADTEFMRPS